MPSPTSPGARTASRSVTSQGRSPAWTALSLLTHADQALGLLTNPSDEEVTTLKEFGYSRNVTVLHTDGSVLRTPRGPGQLEHRMTPATGPNSPLS